jgi:hypothetical protein
VRGVDVVVAMHVSIVAIVHDAKDKVCDGLSYKWFVELII